MKTFVYNDKLHIIMNERERIELLMKCYELTPSQFADRTGIQRASISHIISGRNKPSLEVLQKIYEAFPELDIKWLMTGSGEEPIAKIKGNDGLEEMNNLFSQPLKHQNQEAEAHGVHQTVGSYTGSQSVLPMQEPLPQQKTVQQSKPLTERVQRRQQPPKVRQQNTAERRIKEIRIFYTDGTYETLFPEKQ